MTESGILLIDKPEGPSSAQIVHRVKTLLNAKKAGHLGTLDPFASGLLLLGINEGTKVADIFLGSSKSYRGVMRLGIETDSQDCTGKPLAERPVPEIGAREIQSLEQTFVGEIQQIPPMFSALKKGGVRLYQLARQGKTIPREARSVRIESLRLQKLNAAEIGFDVTCSRGTYVRTLAADMGSLLGCGGHLRSLRRTACGHLTVEESVSVEQLETLQARNQVPLVPLAAALCHLRHLTWQTPWLSRLRLGQQNVLAQIGRPYADERLVRILDPRGDLVALAEWDESISGGRWRINRVFHG